jgi:hypothetical protein
VQSQARPPSSTRAKPKIEARGTNPKPEAKKVVKQRSSSTERTSTKVALSAPGQDSSSGDNLLFLGGLALLVLVLGDAAFLALASRTLRDPTAR